MDLTRQLSDLIAGRDLAREEVEELFGRLMDGELSEVQKTALLVALAAKGESPGEIAGAAVAMRQRVVKVPHRVTAAVDTCGTGGDGVGTFNISTGAALVAAAGGVAIAKHGNRSVSSRSGSADVLAELGVDLDLEAAALGRCLEEVGIAFLFAPRLHPAMKEVMSVRRALGVRTLFNVLGPLTNPAGVPRQVLGVYSAELVEPIGRVLSDLGSEHAMVVHGDGLDEITTTGSTTVCEVRGGEVESYTLDPRTLGLAPAQRSDLLGGEPEDNAATMNALLGGEPGPIADVVALNAAAALYVGGAARDLMTGLRQARSLLGGGAAARKLEQLVAFGHSMREESGADNGETAGG